MGFNIAKLVDAARGQCENDFFNRRAKGTEESEIFYSKYIEPMLKKDPEMEEDFHGALAAHEFAAFRDGFQSCVDMILSGMAAKL